MKNLWIISLQWNWYQDWFSHHTDTPQGMFLKRSGKKDNMPDKVLYLFKWSIPDQPIWWWRHEYCDAIADTFVLHNTCRTSQWEHEHKHDNTNQKINKKITRKTSVVVYLVYFTDFISCPINQSAKQSSVTEKHLIAFISPKYSKLILFPYLKC